MTLSEPSAAWDGLPGSSNRPSLYFAAMTVTRKRPWSGSSRSEILKFAFGPYVPSPPKISSLGMAGRSSSPCGTVL